LWFRKTALGLCVAIVLVLAALGPSLAGTRLALVLGNAKYQNVPELGNPANDASDVAEVLARLGFDVIEQRDATRDAMARAIHDFSDRLAGAEVALFFYAGHGLQMNGENYLLPVDAKIQNAADVRFNTINLADLRQEMESAGRTSIIILDACRNNPFADKLAQTGRAMAGRGLVPMDAAAQGSLIVYATQPNAIASDGAGRNSPFTAALLKHVATPGLEVRQMISRVRRDVLAATEQKQTPWDSSSLVGDVYLAGQPGAPAAAAAPGPAQPPEAMAAAEPDNDCDRIAAPRAPVSQASAVRERTEPDWAAAVPACEAMIKAHPAEMRFVDQLGRAQDHLKIYVEAARNYRIASAGGDPDAAINLGALYYYGHGVLQSDTRAFELFAKAAVGSSLPAAHAMANMGSMYGDGRGVAKDDAKSLDLEERAVEMGYPIALRMIATHYFNGAGVARDYQMAAQYLRQAIDAGDGFSMKFLANMIEGGYLGKPDLAKAGELRRLAVQIDPDSHDPTPLPMVRPAAASVPAGGPAHRRRYVIYRPASGASYNPAWQAAPGETRCCPNSMLVCPLGRHFCGR
jgi:TPR repeat protein